MKDDDDNDRCLECTCNENEECYFTRLNRLEDKQSHTIHVLEVLTDTLDRLVYFLNNKL